MKNLLKTTLSVFILALTCQLSFGQANQGAWMVGGSVGFTSHSIKDVDDKTTDINVSPNVGYFVINNLAVGLNLDWNSSKTGDADADTDLGIGPWARYYVYKGLFAQAGYNYRSLKLGGGDAVNGGNILLGVGYSWFLNNSVAIEPALGYSIGSGDLLKDHSTFGLRIGVQAFIGRE